MTAPARLIYRAHMAQRCRRYDDMIRAAEEIVQHGDFLTRQERGLVADAYRLAIGQKRLAWRLMNQIAERKRNQKKLFAFDTTSDYIRIIEDEIKAYVRSGLKTVDKLNVGSTDMAVFAAKLKADFYRYLAEVDGSAKDDAKRAYERAEQEADRLPNDDPLRLGTYLNSAVFKFEILRDSSGAIKTAEDALSATNRSKDPVHQTVIGALLEKNLRMWRR